MSPAESRGILHDINTDIVDIDSGVRLWVANGLDHATSAVVG